MFSRLKGTGAGEKEIYKNNFFAEFTNSAQNLIILRRISLQNLPFLSQNFQISIAEFPKFYRRKLWGVKNNLLVEKKSEKNYLAEKKNEKYL